LADPLQYASEQTLVLILAALAEGNIEVRLWGEKQVVNHIHHNTVVAL
jgi:hypothetical protein